MRQFRANPLLDSSSSPYRRFVASDSESSWVASRDAGLHPGGEFVVNAVGRQGLVSRMRVGKVPVDGISRPGPRCASRRKSSPASVQIHHGLPGVGAKRDPLVIGGRIGKSS